MFGEKGGCLVKLKAKGSNLFLGLWVSASTRDRGEHALVLRFYFQVYLPGCSLKEKLGLR